MTARSRQGKGEAAVTGRCLCGAVRFRFGDKPVLTRACWCRDCHYLSSGNASVSGIFQTGGLAVSGELAEYVGVADSGNVMRRRFCRACGTPVFSEAAGQPDFVAVRVGTLDDREIGCPASTIWTSSAPGWACWDRSRPSYERHVEAVPGS